MSRLYNHECCFATVNCLVFTQAYIRQFKRYLWRKMTCQKKPKKNIVLLVVGLDNAGKTTVTNYLHDKKSVKKDNVLPTIGFRTLTFKYKNCNIRLYDVGGSRQIRALWEKYYGDVHGLIYVMDAHDIERFDENAQVFQDMVCNELVTGKPILFLAHKHDYEEAIVKKDIIRDLNIQNAVNYAKCYTRVEICSCFPDLKIHNPINKNIDLGFDWLIKEIKFDYRRLEALIRNGKKNVKLNRTSTIKSWAAEFVHNPFDYPDSDSDVYLKPIVPIEETIEKPKKERKYLRNFFRTKNKTAPMPGAGVPPTPRTMRKLIKSMKIEDLIRTTRIDEYPVSEFRLKRPWTKKRPKTAPSAIKVIEVRPAAAEATEPDVVTLPS